MQLPAIRTLMRKFPLNVGTTGRVRDMLLKAGDRLAGESARGEAQVEIDGVQLGLDLTHDNERLIAYCGDNLLRSFRRTPLGRYIRSHPARGNALFVDIGANLGLYSLLSREVGYVPWLFEPEPRHVAFLTRNAQALGRLFPIALSDAAGQADLFVSKADNAGASSLIGTGSDYSGSVPVPLERFDVLAQRELGPHAIGLVKVDVEGAEEAVIRGMTGVLSTSRPPVWCEVRGPRSTRKANTYVAVVATFKEHGYTAWEPTGRTFKPFVPRDDQRVFDLLFTTAPTP